MYRSVYCKKIMGLSLLFFLSLSIPLWSFYTHLNHNLNAVQQELHALEIIQPLLKVIHHTQNHRGLSLRFIQGNHTLIKQLIVENNQQHRLITQINQQLPKQIKERPLWKYILFKQQDIKNQGLSWTIAHNFSAHSHLIKQLQKFIVTIADSHQLTLDPQLSSTYLIHSSLIDIPLTLEYFAQIRGYGVYFLEQKEPLTHANTLKLLTSLIQLNQSLLPLTTHLEKSSQFNSSIASTLLLISNEIKLAAQTLDQHSQESILSNRVAYSSHDFLHFSTQSITSGYTHIEKTLIAHLKATLIQREQTLYRKLWAVIGSTVLSASSAYYLLLLLYYAMKSSPTYRP